MAESITVNLLANDRMSPALKSAGDASLKAAAGAKILAEGLAKQRKAADVSVGATLTLAKADKILAEAEAELAGKALVADEALRRQGAGAKKAARETGGARGGVLGLTGAVTGFGDAVGVADRKGSMFARALAGINLATGVLEPALAGLVVTVGGLGAGMVAAGVGLGVFGLVAGKALKQMKTDFTAITKLQMKLGQGGLSAAQEKALRQQLARQQKAFQETYGAAATGWNNLQKAFGRFTEQTRKPVLGILGRGFDIAASVLPKLKQFLPPVEAALRRVLGYLDAFLHSAAFGATLTALAKASGPIVGNLGDALVNILRGIFGITRAFLPFSKAMFAGLDAITEKFAIWGETLTKHTGFQSLMTMWRTETPQAVAILKNLGTVLLNVGKSMTGLSTFANSRSLLQALLPVSQLLANLSKNQALDRIVLYLYAAHSAASKLRPAILGIRGAVAFFPAAATAVAAFAGATEGATVAETIAAAATRAWGIAMDALPWVALAAAVVTVAVLVIKYHRQIWHFVQRVWDDILGAIAAVWHWVQKNWPYIAGALAGPIGIAVVAIVKHWGTILSGIKAVGHDVVTFFGNLRGWILGAFRAAGSWLYNKGKDIVTGLWSGLKAIWKSVTSWFGGLPKKLLSLLGIHSPPKWAIEAGQHIMGGLLKGLGLGSGLAAWGRGIAGSVGGAMSSSLSVAIGRTMAAAAGWTGPQWNALYALWQRESGWRWNALNPTSGAYGIPQSLPASKMASAGPDWRTNPATQIRWGLGYIAGRYGSPLAAWGHENRFGWYGSGLQGGVFTRPTLIGVGDRGPERVDVTPLRPPMAGLGRTQRVEVVLKIEPGRVHGEFERALANWIHSYVRVKGGGSVETAFGES